MIDFDADLMLVEALRPLPLNASLAIVSPLRDTITTFNGSRSAARPSTAFSVCGACATPVPPVCCAKARMDVRTKGVARRAVRRVIMDANLGRDQHATMAEPNDSREGDGA